MGLVNRAERSAADFLEQDELTPSLLVKTPLGGSRQRDLGPRLGFRRVRASRGSRRVICHGSLSLS